MFQLQSANRDLLHVSAALGARLVIQSFSFFLVARTLGPQGFGAFAGAAATIALLLPFATWGAGAILIQQAVRNPAALNAFWGGAIVLNLLVGTVLCLLLVAAEPLVFPDRSNLALIVPIAAAELVVLRMADLAASAAQAAGRLDLAGRIILAGSGMRLFAAVAFAALPLPKTPEAWAAAYLLLAFPPALYSTQLVARVLGRPQYELRPLVPHLKSGLFLSGAAAGQQTMLEADKAMLAHMAPLHVLGPYAAATKLVEALYVPIRSILYTAYARFFAAGSEALAPAAAAARRLVPLVVGYGLATVLGVWLCGPLLPWLLGDGFAMTANVCSWLVVSMVLRAVAALGADAVTGAGLHAARGAMQFLAAALNVALNYLLIGPFGWRGAAAASIVSFAVLAFFTWGFIAYRSRQAGVAHTYPAA